MTSLKFIHSSDLHLGRRFAGYAQGDRLTEARHAVLPRLAQGARDTGAAHILIAGDVFETPNPSPQTLAQAMAEMRGASDMTWWLLPGNHDNLREAEASWEHIAAHAPANIRVLRDAAAVALEGTGPVTGAMLLPAPVTTRMPGSDLTRHMPQVPTPEGALRIGLAHGPVQSFDGGEAGGEAAVIAPDRDRSAGLEYLALGDWHGALRVSGRVQYSGAPEYTGFRHSGRGACLAVSIAGPGALPEVSQIETGRFAWREASLRLAPAQDAVAAFLGELPEGARRDLLLRVVVSGRSRLGAIADLRMIAAQQGPEFCHFAVDLAGLAVEHAVGDLDDIATSGALRAAAEALESECRNEEVDAPTRAVAEAALSRLYSLVRAGTDK